MIELVEKRGPAARGGRATVPEGEGKAREGGLYGEDVGPELDGLHAALGRALDLQRATGRDRTDTVQPLPHRLRGDPTGASEGGTVAEDVMGALDGRHAAHRKALPLLAQAGDAGIGESRFTIQKSPVVRTSSEIATALQAALEKSGLRQVDLARALGVTPQSVRGWLATGRVAKGRLPAIAEALGVSLDFILGGNVGNMEIVGTATNFVASAAELQTKAVGFSAPIVMGKLRRVPVTCNAPFADSQFVEPHTFSVADGFIRWPSEDPAAYAIRVIGDGLAPRLKHSEYIVIEPGRAPVVGDEVLIHSTSGGLLLAELLAERSDVIKVLAINERGGPFHLPRSQIVKMEALGGLARRGQWSSTSTG